MYVLMKAQYSTSKKMNTKMESLSKLEFLDCAFLYQRADHGWKWHKKFLVQFLLAFVCINHPQQAKFSAIHRLTSIKVSQHCHYLPLHFVLRWTIDGSEFDTLFELFLCGPCLVLLVSPSTDVTKQITMCSSSSAKLYWRCRRLSPRRSQGSTFHRAFWTLGRVNTTWKWN